MGWEWRKEKRWDEKEKRVCVVGWRWWSEEEKERRKGVWKEENEWWKERKEEGVV